MKKSFLTVMLACCVCLVAHAYTMYGRFCYQEDGKTTAWIELSADGRVEMADYEIEKHWSGTYEIEGESAPMRGEVRTIIFHIDGQTHRGKYAWPLQGKQAIAFDGLYFELSDK